MSHSHFHPLILRLCILGMFVKASISIIVLILHPVRQNPIITEVCLPAHFGVSLFRPAISGYVVRSFYSMDMLIALLPLLLIEFLDQKQSCGEYRENG